ncbi:MAG: hypothetical protein GYB65_12700, partial [Chloroflexi bacterium]|nr:hypothetical protein [Chloroflexota bacterium]
SRFLYDIPAEVREGQPLSKPGAAAVERDAYRRMTTWERAASAAQDRRRRAERAEPPPSFKAGTCVWHNKYGEGVVVSSRHRGDVEEVEVLFPGDFGQKTILADFLSVMED